MAPHHVTTTPHTRTPTRCFRAVIDVSTSRCQRITCIAVRGGSAAAPPAPARVTVVARVEAQSVPSMMGRVLCGHLRSCRPWASSLRPRAEYRDLHLAARSILRPTRHPVALRAGAPAAPGHAQRHAHAPARPSRPCRCCRTRRGARHSHPPAACSRARPGPRHRCARP